MKTTTKYLSILALIVSAAAQSPEPSGNRGQQPQGPKPPLIAVLDANGDNEFSADEIAKAAASLAGLDANGDGKITMEELRPKPPTGEELLAPKPPVNQPQGDRPQGQPQGQALPMRRPPPIIQALDKDHDGKISTEEMQAASEALKSLDKNTDGELTGEEMFGPPVQGQPQGQPQRPQGEPPNDGVAPKRRGAQ
jgi:Ca2+-binding EF-hand superfamily protein